MYKSGMTVHVFNYNTELEKLIKKSLLANQPSCICEFLEQWQTLFQDCKAEGMIGEDTWSHTPASSWMCMGVHVHTHVHAAHIYTTNTPWNCFSI